MLRLELQLNGKYTLRDTDLTGFKTWQYNDIEARQLMRAVVAMPDVVKALMDLTNFTRFYCTPTPEFETEYKNRLKAADDAILKMNSF